MKNLWKMRNKIPGMVVLMYFLSLIYGLITGIRNKLYDFNILKAKKVENTTIICVGNITAGGTGKTPAVQYFAKKMLMENKKVAVLSRGYNGKRKEDPMIVRNEKEIYATALEAGDETYLHALNLKIPVAVAKDRYSGARLLKEKYDVDVIILDDGYQHRKLFRDKNILLIDATNPFGGNHLLPKGRLRESLAGIKRADEIIITKVNYTGMQAAEPVIKKLEKYNKPLFLAEHKEDYFYNQKLEKFDFNVIKDKKVLLFSSIASPENFKKSILKLGSGKLDEIKFSDHHVYSDVEIDEIIREAKDYDFVITTEKDIVKINKNIENLLILKISFNIL
ncbi:tetraacyldisaccharide 4'-kinase [Sebaldella termitidis]|uniref:tetraacyldisaccharide 4'-kinase n=1 Tax=Sebaldella termitidis TaxID=826 RepID=UPI003EB8FEFD